MCMCVQRKHSRSRRRRRAQAEDVKEGGVMAACCPLVASFYNYSASTEIKVKLLLGIYVTQKIQAVLKNK